ncbi:MAG: hypothetical protein AAB482_02580 [Patescibacteria group bacterium]
MNARKFGALELFITLGIFALIAGGVYSFWKLNSEKSSHDSTMEDAGSKENQSTSSASGKPTTVVSSPKQKLQLRSPNGGEVWVRGKQYNVRWTSELPDKTRIIAVIFKSSRVISNPYTSASTVTGFEMFSPTLFPESTNEGSFVYRVPDSLAPGQYQILLWAGDNCNPNDKTKHCDFDLSNGLLTVK